MLDKDYQHSIVSSKTRDLKMVSNKLFTSCKSKKSYQIYLNMKIVLSFKRQVGKIY